MVGLHAAARKHQLVLHAYHQCHAAEDISIPEVREGWHMWWHPYGKAMLPEHITVVHPSSLPWASDSYTMYLDQGLIYNWLDQANMYHVMMETGNFIYATACKLLGACTHATSHYQILSTVSNRLKLSESHARCNDAVATSHILTFPEPFAQNIQVSA